MRDDLKMYEVLKAFKGNSRIPIRSLKLEFTKVTKKTYQQAYYNFVLFLEAFDLAKKDGQFFNLDWKNIEKFHREGLPNERR
jgi:hypothetical protein